MEKFAAPSEKADYAPISWKGYFDTLEFINDVLLVYK